MFQLTPIPMFAIVLIRKPDFSVRVFVHLELKISGSVKFSLFIALE